MHVVKPILLLLMEVFVSNETLSIRGQSQKINQLLFRKTDDIDPNEIRIQQDDSTCHSTNETTNLSREKFGAAITSRSGAVS